jgi:hypothetical protein
MRTSAAIRCDARNRRAPGRLRNPVGRRIPAVLHVCARQLRGAGPARSRRQDRRRSGSRDIGSSGMMTEAGLAFLVWREGRPYLIAKGSETPASRTGGGDSEVFFGFETRFGRGPGRNVARSSRATRAELVISKERMTLDEQLSYLRKGMAEIIREEDLRERLVQPKRSGRRCASRSASTRPRPTCTWATPCCCAR